jgi:hypothetical protein
MTLPTTLTLEREEARVAARRGEPLQWRVLVGADTMEADWKLLRRFLLLPASAGERRRAAVTDHGKGGWR